MKKILFLFALVFSFAVSHAQSRTVITMPLIAGDSLVNTDSVQKLITISASYSNFTVQVNVKKGTGTLTGKLYLYSSCDNVTYTLTDSASYTTPLISSFTSSPYTAQAIISKNTPGVTSYWAVATSSGSITSSPTQFIYTVSRYTAR